MNINELNQRLGKAGRIAFRLSAHGMPEIVLVSGYGFCEISLYGGQVLNYRPTGHTPVLFVSDITKVSVTGLDGMLYTDLLTKEKRTQAGPLKIGTETYHIYEAEDAACAIQDAGLSRNIVVATEGINKLVTWNPWQEKSKQLEEFGDEEYRGMITLAPAVTADQAAVIQPGEKITIKTAIQAILT